MTSKRTLGMGPLTSIAALGAALCLAQPAHAACEREATDDAGLKTCLSQDLRDADKRINAVYKALQDTLDESGKLALRNEQRDWLKRRDKACFLSNKEADRERWLQAILANREQIVWWCATP